MVCLTNTIIGNVISEKTRTVLPKSITVVPSTKTLTAALVTVAPPMVYVLVHHLNI